MKNKSILCQDSLVSQVLFSIAQIATISVRAVNIAYEGQKQYHITGLPVAEATFGVEMFDEAA